MSSPHPVDFIYKEVASSLQQLDPKVVFGFVQDNISVDSCTLAWFLHIYEHSENFIQQIILGQFTLLSELDFSGQQAHLIHRFFSSELEKFATTGPIEKPPLQASTPSKPNQTLGKSSTNDRRRSLDSVKSQKKRYSHILPNFNGPQTVLALTTLNLSQAVNLKTPTLIQILKRSPQLFHLSLTKCYYLDFSEIGRCLKNANQQFPNYFQNGLLNFANSSINTGFFKILSEVDFKSKSKGAKTKQGQGFLMKIVSLNIAGIAPDRKSVV